MTSSSQTVPRHVIAGIQRNKKVEIFSPPIALGRFGFLQLCICLPDFIKRDTVHTIKPQVEVIRTGVPVGAEKISKRVLALPERIP